MSDRKPLNLDVPSETALVPGKTCVSCRHYVALRQAPQPGPALLTGQPKVAMGQCREGPPHLTIMPNGVQVSDYPPVSENFPACGHFSPLASEGIEIDHNGERVRHCVKCGKMVPLERFRLTGDKCDACVSYGKLP